MSETPETLPRLLAGVAAAHGDRVALVSRRGRRRFGEVATRVGRLAAGLAAQGVGPGAHVGLLAPNWPEWIELAFAVWRTGAVLVPLNTLYRPRELEHALGLADVTHLIAVRRFLRHDYEAALASVTAPTLQTVLWLDPPMDDEAPVELGPLDLDASVPDRAVAGAPATIVFTSGSTAAPKGVVHTHAALVCAAREDAAVLGIEPADRTWGYLPFFFAGGLVAVALATLSRGAAVVLQEVFEPGETLRLLAAERVTVFFAWPHQAEALVRHAAFDRDALALCKGVGANTKWAPAIYGPSHHAVGSYGMTEIPPLCTAWPWDAPQHLRETSHGRPVGAKELRIWDPRTGRALPAGETGEICVRGPSLLAGYYKEPRESCFDAEGWFRTGDLGWLGDDGALHFVGRAKDVIKSGGANVAAAEVEAVLAEHPAVTAAYVVGVPDPARGESVAAFVVTRAAIEPHALLRHCQERLASYKVPRHVWFRSDASLPKKGSGKADKTALRAEAARLAGGDPAD